MEKQTLNQLTKNFHSTFIEDRYRFYLIINDIYYVTNIMEI